MSAWGAALNPPKYILKRRERVDGVGRWKPWHTILARWRESEAFVLMRQYERTSKSGEEHAVFHRGMRISP